jgi:hypothetical protein
MRTLQLSLLRRDLEIDLHWRGCFQKLNVVVMTRVR